MFYKLLTTPAIQEPPSPPSPPSPSNPSRRWAKTKTSGRRSAGERVFIWPRRRPTQGCSSTHGRAERDPEPINVYGGDGVAPYEEAPVRGSHYALMIWNGGRRRWEGSNCQLGICRQCSDTTDRLTGFFLFFFFFLARRSAEALRRRDISRQLPLIGCHSSRLGR